ncbi:LuxR family transcriptional regulator [Sphingopyxis sp.]|jgi:DNA-binding CsgD family transcriptional regulator|uniref:LuxR family transcriptional regulator n=1 Tax=Sphingopyxis sp. TaxID=1908224 RepID=UPI003F701B18
MNDVKHYYLTEELAQEFTGADREEQLFAALTKAAGRMGFDHFALAFDRRGTGEPASILVHNYPDAWAKVYVGFDLSGTDPIRRASERSLTGFEWRHVDRYIPLSRGDRQLLSVARESGVGDGFTVPRHLPGEASGTCSFAVRPHADIPADMLHAAEILGAIAIASARELIGSSPLRPRPMLTERQRECVLWSARGKTAGEIADILGISEETVVRHLKMARDRYSVHCRSMLILCALFDGLIGFSDIYDWWRPN